MADDTYQAVIESVKVAQMATFLDAKSSSEAREEAHQIIRALNKIEDYINTVLTDEKIFDKTNT
jgi:hypothetical protein